MSKKFYGLVNKKKYPEAENTYIVINAETLEEAKEKIEIFDEIVIKVLSKEPKDKYRVLCIV
jgi:hypothetical protein